MIKTTNNPIIPAQRISSHSKYPTVTTNKGAVHMAFKYYITKSKLVLFLCSNGNLAMNSVVPLTLHQNDKRRLKEDSLQYQMMCSPMLHAIISKPIHL